MSQDDGCPSRALESSALLSSLSLQLPAPSSPSSSSSLSPMQAPVLRLGPRLSLGAEDASGFGNGRLLTKSRSISASSRIDSAMPRFPGPLLPTVRRLNSSPASSKVGTREMGNGDAPPLATDSKTLFVSLVTDSPVASNSGSIVEAQAVVQDRGSVDMRPRHGNREVVEPRTPDYSTSLSSKGESATSWARSSGITFASSEFTRAWRSRPRIEVHGNDSPPPKAQRVSVDDDLGSDYTKSSQFRARKDSQASSFELSSRPRNGTAPGPPQRHSSASKLLADKYGGRSIRDGSSSSSRRRRLPQSESSKYMSDAWMSEVKQPMQTCTTSVEGSALPLDPSKTKPLKLPSSIGWPIGLNKSALSRMSLLLLLLIIIPWSIHSVAQHRELKLLKREMARLQAASCHIGRTQSSNDSKEVAEEDANVLWQASLIVGLVLLLYGSSLTRHGLAISHFIRRSRDKCTDEDVPISKHVAYLVDVLFSTHSYAKAMALLLATLLLIAFGGFSLYAVGDEDLSDALWRSWTYVADSGNHADSVGLGPRIVSVSISIGGMLIFALMLGLVSDAISEKVDSLRKGKSEVIESNHTLILGWSDKLGSLLQQLSIANQSLGGGVVVVLAERDKEEMESDIAKLEFDFMGTSVICRSGSPLIMADLKKVSVSKARSIIVLAEVENADQSDARALRVVLSLTAVREGLRGHVVVELSDLDNEPLVKLVGGEVVETVVAHDVIGRLMIQCARQPGLAQIWEDILGFDKAEFYLKRWPVLDGMRFQDVLVSFPDAIPCGVKVAAEKGKIALNPPDNYVLSPGDEILVIAEDDDTYAPASLPQLRRGSLPKVMEIPKYPEKILFCGWRRDIHDMIKVLDAFLPSGSELWIFSDVGVKEREKKLMEENCDEFPNLKLEHREGNPVIRRHLESLPLQSFDSILILADEQLEENVVVADSRSLATLLLIRDIQSKRLPLSASRVTQSRRSGFTHSSWIGEMQQASDKSIIISEILDSRTRHLVSVSQIGDYVLSNELVSMALAMVAEEKQINRVLEELFGEEGNELYIRSAEFYLYDQEELSFFEIMIRARQRKETMIGYRRSSQERAIINPPNKAAIQKWSIDDVFVVLADHSNPATTSTTKTWSMSSGPSVLR